MNDKFLESLFDMVDLIARNALIERFHFIQESGLSHSQMMSLFYLNQNQNLPVNALASYLDISKSTVSQMIDQLVGANLVRRIANPHDRRGKLLELTENGKEIVSQAKIAHHHWIQATAEEIEPEDIQEIEKSVQIIYKILKNKASVKNSSPR